MLPNFLPLHQKGSLFLASNIHFNVLQALTHNFLKAHKGFPNKHLKNLPAFAHSLVPKSKPCVLRLLLMAVLHFQVLKLVPVGIVE